MRLIYLPLCVLSLVLFGCEKDAQSLDRQEERNSHIKQGQAYLDIKDWDKAEAEFKAAIDDEPRMARPYLELGVIYQQHKPDFISSIFYYKRYLELRPNSEKKEFINEQIQKVQMALAKAILTQSGAFRAIEERDKLRKENTLLRHQVATKGAPRAVTKPAPKTTAATKSSVATPKPVTKAVPKSSIPVKEVKKTPAPKVATSGEHQLYQVASGDNLTKIAQKFYGNGNYNVIYEANRESMKSPGDLRVGQTLVIPTLP